MLNNKKYTAKGFTLIELMVTVAVLVVVATIAVPSYNQLINSNRLTSEVNSFIGAFNFAKSEAVRQNQHIILCHSNDQTNCSTPVSNNWRGWIVVPAPVVADATPLRVGMFSSKLVNNASAALVGTNHQIRFTPTGLVRTPNSAFVMLNGTLSFCVASTSVQNNVRLARFASGGRIHVEAVDASGNCSQPSNG